MSMSDANAQQYEEHATGRSSDGGLEHETATPQTDLLRSVSTGTPVGMEDIL
jgi:hypothetical protein